MAEWRMHASTSSRHNHNIVPQLLPWWDPLAPVMCMRRAISATE